jgi:hypothetical protein
MENLNEIASNTLGLLVLIISVAELIGYLTWDKRYFRFGIPIFIRNIPIHPSTFVTPSVSHMEVGLPSSFWGPSIKFKEIGQGEYAFRNAISEIRFWGFKYPPIMHGYLMYDNDKKRIVVKGYLIVAYPLLMLYVLGVVISFEAALILLVIFASFSYLFQAMRFNTVADMVTNLSTPGSSQAVNAG